MSEEATSAPEWMASLPEELQGNETLRQTADVATLAQRFIDTKALVGNSLRIPGENASAEERAAFAQDIVTKGKSLNLVPRPGEGASDEEMAAYRTAMGIPTATDAYSFDAVKVPEGLQLDGIDEFKALALELGLDPTQATKILEHDIGRKQAQGAARSALIEEGKGALRQEWGANYDAIEQTALMGAQGMSPEFAEMIKTSDLRFNPVVMKALAGYGNKLVESGQMQADAPGVASRVSATEAKNQMREIRSNSEHAYNNIRDPDHKQAVADMQNLTRLSMGLKPE